MTAFDLERPKSPSHSMSVVDETSLDSFSVDEENASPTEEEEPDNPTSWKCIIIGGILIFLTGFESAVTSTSEWPYMHEIDPNATYGFYGIATSIANWANVVTTVLFSLWTYRYQTVRWPLLSGRVLGFLGSCLYVCVELFPSGRRFVMLTCYIIFAIAKSSACVLRVYMVLVSSKADRSKAFALVALAVMASLVVGPLISLAFSGIAYPGARVLPHINFNLFSAPIWVATVVNIFTVFFIFFGLPEMPKTEKKDGPSLGAIEYVKQSWAKLKSVDVSWILVIAIFVIRFCFLFGVSTVGGVLPVIFMNGFGWDNTQTVRWMSISMGVIGVISTVSGTAIVKGPIPKWVPSRVQILVMFVVTTVMYICSYPYPFLSTPLKEYNATTGLGCNPDDYSWCDSRAPYPYIFLPFVLGCLGFALPVGNIALDTIYSKIVGEADQSLMQGLCSFLDGINSILSPLYSSRVFIARGQTILWICNASFSIAGLIVTVVFFRRLRKFN